MRLIECVGGEGVAGKARETMMLYICQRMQFMAGLRHLPTHPESTKKTLRQIELQSDGHKMMKMN